MKSDTVQAIGVGDHAAGRNPSLRNSHHNSDEALARALQENEDAQAAAQLYGALEEDFDLTMVAHDSSMNNFSDDSNQRMRAALESNNMDSTLDGNDNSEKLPPRYLPGSEAYDSDSNESDSVVWEEGDDVPNEQAKRSMLKSQSPDNQNQSDAESVIWINGGKAQDTVKQIHGDRTCDSESVHCSSEESIAWEDGDKSESSPKNVDHKFALKESARQQESNLQENYEKIRSNPGSKNKPSRLLQSESSEDLMMRNAFVDSDPSASSPPLSSDRKAETAAVFERAQETAANLADWAGRAFRRAMKDAVEGDIKAQNVDSKEMIPPDNSRSEESREREIPHQTKVSGSVQPSEIDLSERKRTATNTAPHRSLGRAIESPQEAAEITEDLLKKWEAERNQRERDNDTVTDEMKEEAIRLLQLFGVPYIEAPAEAEAQCVALEQLGLVNGIVTEDSDAFAFGAKKVYKNIFEEQKFAEAYMADDAQKEMGLSHDAMVALAMLLGSDYTTGVKGVGIVNAMEVLEEFEVAGDVKEGLSNFASWLDGFDPSDTSLKTTETSTKKGGEQSFHEKHKSARSRWIAPSNFPADNVIAAYRNPVVDKSTQPFSWGKPDVEGLVHFCAKNIGWPAEETRKMLEPVVARKNERYSQTRIDSFIRYEHGLKFADVRSKRLRAVLESKKKSKKMKTVEQVGLEEKAREEKE